MAAGLTVFGFGLAWHVGHSKCRAAHNFAPHPGCPHHSYHVAGLWVTHCLVELEDHFFLLSGGLIAASFFSPSPGLQPPFSTASSRWSHRSFSSSSSWPSSSAWYIAIFRSSACCFLRPLMTAAQNCFVYCWAFLVMHPPSSLWWKCRWSHRTATSFAMCWEFTINFVGFWLRVRSIASSNMHISHSTCCTPSNSPTFLTSGSSHNLAFLGCSYINHLPLFHCHSAINMLTLMWCNPSAMSCMAITFPILGKFIFCIWQNTLQGGLSTTRSGSSASNVCRIFLACAGWLRSQPVCMSIELPGCRCCAVASSVILGGEYTSVIAVFFMKYSMLLISLFLTFLPSAASFSSGCICSSSALLRKHTSILILPSSSFGILPVFFSQWSCLHTSYPVLTSNMPYPSCVCCLRILLTPFLPCASSHPCVSSFIDLHLHPIWSRTILPHNQPLRWPVAMALGNQSLCRTLLLLEHCL